MLLCVVGCHSAAGRGSGAHDATSRPRQPATEGHREQGKASFYSDRLAGRRTASGEPYDPLQLTAAHRRLPFGTLVRVTRDDGRGKSVVVRINDRGPFGGKGRIIDVSRAAARQLEMIRAGVVKVTIEVVGHDPP